VATKASPPSPPLPLPLSGRGVPSKTRRGEDQLATARWVHFVGVGGSGMSSLAQLMAAHGKRVTGSDLSPEAAERLRRQGLAAFAGHAAQHVGQAELVIVSAAVPADNVELVEARRRDLRILTHAEALGELMQSRLGVALAGTHGKTTTTAMLGHVLTMVGCDPTVLVGAATLDSGSGARLGSGPHLIVEADEYDHRFLALHPTVAIITGIEPDHLDYFRDLREIIAAFRTFARQVAPDGTLVTCADDPVLRRTDFPRRRVTYGLDAAADWRLRRFQPRAGGGCSFDLAGPGGETKSDLRLSGLHNAYNATATLAAAWELGVPLAAAAAALGSFKGTERRFQTVWQAKGIWVVDDYAHHPTAVRATLTSAREVHAGRLWAVFQPHTTNRVAELLEDFATSFEAADRLMLLPIYRPAGRERGGRAVTSADLARAIARPPWTLADSLEQAESDLAAELRPGDLVVVMGAGDVTRLSHALARRLSQPDADA
jgi:UDP-N-acetylmuramate--alanine ligase